MKMYILIVVLPILAFFIAGVFNKFIGKRGSVFITITFAGLAALLAFYIFYDVAFCKNICFFKFSYSIR